MTRLPAPPLTLLRAGAVFAPAALGARDLLLGGGRILAMGEDLRPAAATLGVTEIIEAPEGKLLPGLIDQHMHFLGGGEADGPAGRMPELSAGEILGAGITTAGSLLGTEMEAKTLPQLLRKAHELDAAGLTSFIYTGSMRLPAPCMTGSVRSDIALIEKVLGAKSAIAERLYPNLDFPALAALAGELAQARAMTGKAAVLHLHVGRLRSGLEPVFELLDRVDFPADQVVPTHINRSPELLPLFDQGIRFARQGGVIDFTCCLGPLDGIASGFDVVAAVRRALGAGVPLANITLSSDAGVAVPDPARSGGFRSVPPAILFRDLRRLVREAGLSWAEALPLVTSNVARVLRLGASKGGIAVGMDADLLLLDEADDAVMVIARGHCLGIAAGAAKNRRVTRGFA
ncbi:MAG: beta-aspartyl-peptidase [Rhizobiales bacterium]|nr:beta-aspartyl-peptidase [Hyphomicrobiales bacterium]